MRQIIINTFIFLALAVYVVKAASGDLDLTFNGTGKAVVGFNENSEARAVAIQSDNKIVVAGITYNTTIYDFDFAVARFNTDGTLDTTFGGDGKVTTSLLTCSNCQEEALAIAIQSDGKILVAGTTSGQTEGAIIRYNQNGTLDTDFNQTGFVKIQVPFRYYVPSITIQSDGKILVTGEADQQPGFGIRFGTTRLNSDGSFDTTFGSNGVSVIGIGSQSRGSEVLVHPNGKIYVAGRSYTTRQSLTIISYNNDGSLNTAFDTDGILVADFGIDHDFPSSMLFQPDGKILVGGIKRNSAGYEYGFLARFNLDGSFDTSFDSDGFMITPETINEFVIQTDGKIITTGYQTNDLINYNFLAVRYNSNGSLDNSFSNLRSLWGNNGKVNLDFIPNGIKLDSFGKSVIVGQSNSSNQVFTIVRLQNLAPTAANALIKGKVSTKNGRGIANAVITLQSDTLNEIKMTRTNSFGYYNFEDLQVGANYILTINSKRYRFSQPSIFISLNQDFTDANFIAE